MQQPIISSGDVGTVRVEYTPDSFWEGFILSGTFQREDKPDKVYEQPLSAGACVIPWESVQQDGVIYIGLRGVDATGRVKTAAPVRYRVEKGSAGGTDTAADPTPNIYQQLLAAATHAEEMAQSVRTDANNGAFNGEDGAPGYTPQKGVDYWTDADKAEVKQYVDDAILNGEW